MHKKAWLIEKKVRDGSREVGLKGGKLQGSYRGINRSKSNSANSVGKTKYGNRLSNGCRIKRGTKPGVISENDTHSVGGWLIKHKAGGARKWVEKQNVPSDGEGHMRKDTVRQGLALTAANRTRKNTDDGN